MSWDWDTEDIDPEEDDGKIWVPVTPKTLEAVDAEKGAVPLMAGQVMSPEKEVRPTEWTMQVYTMTGGPKGMAQATLAVTKVINLPKRTHRIKVYANKELSDVSESDGLTGTDGEAKVGKETERKETERNKEKPRGQAKSGKVGGKPPVPNKTPVVTSSTPREIPCDQCCKTKRSCLSRTKGEIVLSTCEECHRVKTVCRMESGTGIGQTEHTGARTEKAGCAEGMSVGLHRGERPAALRAKARLDSCRTSLVLPRNSADSILFLLLVPASTLNKKRIGPDVEPLGRK